MTSPRSFPLEFLDHDETIVNFLSKLESFLNEKLKDGQTLGDGIQRALDTLAKIKVIVQTNKCDVQTTDVQTTTTDDAHENMLKGFHKQLVVGFCYYVQHCVEKSIMGTLGSDMELVESYYKTICLFKQTVLADANASSSNASSSTSSSASTTSVTFLTSLLKYLEVIRDVVGRDKLDQLKAAANSDDMSKVRAIFDELADIPTDTEIAKYNTIYDKLDQIKKLSDKIQLKLQSASASARDMTPRGVIFKACGSNNLAATTCLETQYALGDVLASGTILPGTSVLDSFIKSITQGLKPLAERPTRRDIAILSKPQVSKLYEPALYYELVDYYEQISGAVRVYLRTKDVVQGTPIQPTPNSQGIDEDVANGISKDYARNTIELKLEGTNYKFGPFYNVIKTGISTADIVTSHAIDVDNLASLFSRASLNNTKQNLVLFTYGFSGSGKTYTLFGSGEGVSGLWSSISETMKASGFTCSFKGYKKIYGYMSNKALVKADVPSSQYSFDEFLKKELFVEGDTGNVDAFIKSTPNNKASSRGFLILRFQVTDASGKDLGTIGLVDMAGNEDPYDLMVRLLPTLEWPTVDQAENFINNETSLVKSDFMYKSLRDAYAEVLEMIFGECEYVFGKLNALGGTASDVVKENTRNVLISRFQKTFQEAGKRYAPASTTAPTTFISTINEMLYKTTRRYVAHVLQLLWNSLKSEPKFNLARTRESVFTDKDLKSVFNGVSVDLRNQVIDTDIKYVKGNLSIPLGVKMFDSIGNLMLVYNIIDSRINELIAALPPTIGNDTITKLHQALSGLLTKYDPLDFVELDSTAGSTDEFKDARDCTADIVGNILAFRTTFDDACNPERMKTMATMMKDANRFGKNDDIISDTNNFNGKSEYELYSAAIVELVDSITYNCFTVSRKEVMKLLQLVSLIRYKYGSLIPDMIGNAKSDVLKNKATFNESVRIFPPVLGESEDNLASGVFGTSGNKLKLSSDKKQMSDKANYIDTLWKFKSEFDRYLDDYFGSLKRPVIIDGNVVWFSQQYLLRIIQEGFFINQANVELLDLLVSQQDDVPYDANSQCTVEDTTKLMFEGYDKFKNMFKEGCAVTGLTQELNSHFDLKSTKYIMLVNVRREPDIKFRLGAIDTLKLVENLKST